MTRRQIATESANFGVWKKLMPLMLAPDAMINGKKTLPIGLRKCGAAVVGGLLLFTAAAMAQDSKPAPTPPVREATAAYEPGMLDSVGRWFKDSVSRLSTHVEGARESLGGLGARASGAAKEAADAAKDAADVAKEAVVKFPNARMTDGRERCTNAANGGPDCRQAAETLCKAKGFGSGTSLEIQSAQSCKARVWISGKSDPGDCETRSFVTRAMCQ
jgi:hypothetical protein